MRALFKNCRAYNTEKKAFLACEILVDDGMIVSVGNNIGMQFGFEQELDLDGALLAPGLVDIHTHGCVGGDFASADTEMLLKMSNDYLSHGVTSIFATLASAPYEDLLEALDRIAEVSDEDDSVICGVHLEGIYLDPEKRGAHSKALLHLPDARELEELVFRMRRTSDSIRLSAAFELDADGSFSQIARESGMSMSLAHTNANSEQARLVFSRGVDSVTHLYNAMPLMHHRDGGIVSVALCDDNIFCELIADGYHVCPDMVALAYRCKGEKLVLITDSMEATGCSDGKYRIAGEGVTVKGGQARTADGAIAGSTLRLFDGVKNLASFAGISFEDALYCATASPAQCARIYDQVGSIAVGKAANFIILDEKFNLSGIIFHGEKQ